MSSDGQEYFTGPTSGSALLSMRQPLKRCPPAETCPFSKKSATEILSGGNGSLFNLS